MAEDRRKKATNISPERANNNEKGVGTKVRFLNSEKKKFQSGIQDQQGDLNLPCTS